MEKEKFAAKGSVPFDPAIRYVRLTRVRDDGFIEFEFAIGDPDLAVELIMRREAFDEFCRDNHVRLVPPVQGAAIDRARMRWSTNDAGPDA
jgi:phenol hydroxylase P0 protein